MLVKHVIIVSELRDMLCLFLGPTGWGSFFVGVVGSPAGLFWVCIWLVTTFLVSLQRTGAHSIWADGWVVQSCVRRLLWRRHSYSSCLSRPQCFQGATRYLEQLINFSSSPTPSTEMSLFNLLTQAKLTVSPFLLPTISHLYTTTSFVTSPNSLPFPKHFIATWQNVCGSKYAHL